MDEIDKPKELSHQETVRKHLKLLLLHLAAKSDHPGSDLQILLREVIEELHQEVKEALRKTPHLHLVAGPGENVQI